MRLKKDTLLTYLDFDRDQCLLSVRNVQMLLQFFKMLDVFKRGTLNDVQFYAFMTYMTDLEKLDIEVVFDMLDRETNGNIGFNELYMLVCILLATEYGVEKMYVARHSRHVFDLLVTDCSETVTLGRFKSIGFLFNMHDELFKKMLHDNGVKEDEGINYERFRQLIYACFDMDDEKTEGEEAEK